MLSVLRVSNFALIDEVEVELVPGLNIVTGETGAGKSIFLRALGLIQGGRASSDVVARGAQAAEIEALFLLDERERSELSAQFAELDSATEELLIRRSIDASGKSKVYINGRLATVSMLSAIGERMIAITSQHDQRLLVDNAQQRSLLDAFGVPDPLLTEVAERYLEFDEAEQRYRSFLEKSEEQSLRLERLRAELEELEAADLQPDEREQHEAQLERLANVETLGLIAQECAEALSGEESGVQDAVARLRQTLLRGQRIDSKLDPVVELVSGAAAQLEEASISLAEYATALDADPDRLEQLRARIAEIARLERKFKKRLPELLVYRDALAEEISLHESGAFDLERLETQAKAAREKLNQSELKLSEARMDCALKLQKAVAAGLNKVNMKAARFEVALTKCNSSIHGSDRIEFMFSANPGEPLRPLGKVASGGELSRILLVLKTALSRGSGAALQVFDEIDTGVGGRIAHIVGEKLQQVSRFSQVLVVTHSPQVAAFADRHFVVTKTDKAARSETAIRLLEEDERVGELARMLAGKKVTREFEESAKELLNSRRRNAA